MKHLKSSILALVLILSTPLYAEESGGSGGSEGGSAASASGTASGQATSEAGSGAGGETQEKSTEEKRADILSEFTQALDDNLENPGSGSNASSAEQAVDSLVKSGEMTKEEAQKSVLDHLASQGEKYEDISGHIQGSFLSSNAAAEDSEKEAEGGPSFFRTDETGKQVALSDEESINQFNAWKRTIKNQAEMKLRNGEISSKEEYYAQEFNKVFEAMDEAGKTDLVNNSSFEGLGDQASLVRGIADQNGICLA